MEPDQQAQYAAKYNDIVLPDTFDVVKKSISAGTGVVEKPYVAPDNGSSFTSGSGFIQFTVNGGRVGTFADLRNAYVALSISINPDITAPTTLTMDKPGSLAIFNRIEIYSTSGVQLCECSDLDVLAWIKMIEVQATNADNSAGVLFGAVPNETGAGPVLLDNTHKFVYPLLMPLFQQYINLGSRDGLQIKLYCNSAINVGIQQTATAPTLSNTLLYTSVELHYDTVKLLPDVYNMLQSKIGYIFNHPGKLYQSTSSTITSTGASVFNIPVGFGRKKLQRVYACLRKTANVTGTTTSSHSLDISTLISAELKYNGVTQNLNGMRFFPVDATTPAGGGAACVIAELIKLLDKPLLNAGIATSVDTFSTNVAAPTYAAAVGTFFMAWDLSSGVDTTISESGLDCYTGNIQVVLTSSGAVAASMVSIFGEYAADLVLDMRPEGPKVFQISS